MPPSAARLEAGKKEHSVMLYAVCIPRSLPLFPLPAGAVAPSHAKRSPSALLYLHLGLRNKMRGWESPEQGNAQGCPQGHVSPAGEY